MRAILCGVLAALMLATLGALLLVLS